MYRNIYLLAINKLEGGSYTIDSILQAIKTVTDWALRVGIALAGVSLVIANKYIFLYIDHPPIF